MLALLVVPVLAVVLGALFANRRTRRALLAAGDLIASFLRP